MRHLTALGLLTAAASLSMGCAMCCGPHDYEYGYYGGAWQRDDMCNGRVGSVFAPAGSKVGVGKKPAAAEEPGPLPAPEATPETAPEAAPERKPDDLNASRPLKSVKRTRPAQPARSAAPNYLPENE